MGRYIRGAAGASLGWAVLAQSALAQDDGDLDDDMLPGRSPAQIDALFENLDEVIETIGFYTALVAVLVILLGLALFLRLPRWGAYVLLTLLSLGWLAYCEQHLTGLFWLGVTPEFPELVLLGLALASLHLITAALCMKPGAPLSRMAFGLIAAAALVWGVLLIADLPTPDQIPPVFFAIPAIALLGHAAAVPSFLRLQGVTSGVTRNGAVFALTVTSAVVAAVLFGELSDGVDLVFLLRLVMLAVVAYFTIFFVRHVLSLLYERDTNARLALDAARREAEKTQELLEAEQNYSRARQDARRHTQRLAEASHDIRQPIASLRATMDALTQEQPTEIRAQLTAAFNYLDDLAQSYQDTGSNEAAAIRTTGDGLEEVNAKMIVATLDRMFRKEAEGRGLGFDTDGPDRLINVQPLALIRVLSNLLANAIKHTPSGQVRLTAQLRGAGLCFSVSNTAPLPDRVDGGALFDPFVKSDASEGSGLGLSIVESAAQRFGWRLSWSSTEETGTRFDITVPQT